MELHDYKKNYVLFLFRKTTLLDILSIIISLAKQ